MLYEVITAEIPNFTVLILISRPVCHRITSYNVCYTKLLRCVIYVIVIMGGLALQFTGVEKARAQFQALSAFSGTGFTTKESETMVNHPRRRKVIMYLMILGKAGLVSIIATFASSLKKTNVTELRITSYNVCYTKLLRVVVAHLSSPM